MEARGTILVVDDDPDIAEVLREVLASDGYRVLVASFVTSACDILAALRVGLVVTDAFPPDSSGDRWAPLRPLIDAAHEVPLILCSAHTPTLYADFATNGFAAYLPKPFHLDGLLALVASLLCPEGRATPDPVPPHPAML